MVTEISVDDVVRLKKRHPCGSDEWRVVRIGADIGLRCRGCQRRVLLPRSTAERRIRAIVSHGDAISHEEASPRGE